MTNTSTLALVSVSPLDFTATSLFLPISLAVPFSLPLAVDPAHYRPLSWLLHPGLSQRGPRSFMRRPKGQIPSLITREWAGMRTLPTLLQADSSFACFFFFPFTNARSHTGPCGDSEVGGKHGALGVGEV